MADFLQAQSHRTIGAIARLDSESQRPLSNAGLITVDRTRPRVRCRVDSGRRVRPALGSAALAYCDLHQSTCGLVHFV